ncbi:uncharacterized protein LOC143888860 [Tasmannia lanceolata]|uniref:uncharacterized protein LOC143888860 n=1 Tax=Tasmannia lanceolata TaxID=3420 RepID=UPI004063349B
MAPSVAVLQNHSVPNSMISKLISIQPRTMILNNSRFCEIVATVKEMGFNPAKENFILAVRVTSGISKLNWERKVGVLRSFVGLKMRVFQLSKCISKYATILSFSLEKRIIPRCSVVQVIMSKGLIKKDLYLASMSIRSEKKFLQKFVIKNLERVPELLSIYQGKMELLG